MTLEELDKMIGRVLGVTTLVDLEVEFVTYSYDSTVRATRVDGISISPLDNKVIITLSP